MSGKPRIPVSPQELPQQRLYLVRRLPEAPPAWAVLVDSALQGFGDIAMPRSARYLGQVEWAWSPMHNRLSSYYISMDRAHMHWLLWARPYDTNWDRWGEPFVRAASLRCGLQAASAAKLLLAEVWSSEVHSRGLDRFHWVGDIGLLGAGEFNEIADAVWGREQAPGDEEDDGDGEDGLV
jgi:hypothetical protein